MVNLNSLSTAVSKLVFSAHRNEYLLNMLNMLKNVVHFVLLATFPRCEIPKTNHYVRTSGCPIPINENSTQLIFKGST